jgi:predicted ferric reductase
VLSGQTLAAGKDRRTEVWFCGPQGLANALKAGLQDTCRGRFDFHQEAFEMR